jgi:hypothetical protein
MDKWSLGYQPHRSTAPLPNDSDFLRAARFFVSYLYSEPSYNTPVTSIGEWLLMLVSSDVLILTVQLGKRQHANIERIDQAVGIDCGLPSEPDSMTIDTVCGLKRSRCKSERHSKMVTQAE